MTRRTDEAARAARERAILDRVFGGKAATSPAVAPVPAAPAGESLARFHRRVSEVLLGVAYGGGLFEDVGRENAAAVILGSAEAARLRALGRDPAWPLLLEVLRAERDAAGPDGGYLRAPDGPGTSPAFVDLVASIAGDGTLALERAAFAEANRVRRVVGPGPAGLAYGRLATRLPGAIGRASAAMPSASGTLLKAAGFATEGPLAFAASASVEGVQGAVLHVQIEEFVDYPGEYAVRMRLEAADPSRIEHVEARLVNFHDGAPDGDTGWLDVSGHELATTLRVGGPVGRLELNVRGFEVIDG